MLVVAVTDHRIIDMPYTQELDTVSKSVSEIG